MPALACVIGDMDLVRPLGRDIGDFLHAMMPEVRQFPAIDHRFQAITVKRGDFARFSNFLWALDHASPRPQDLARLMYQLHSYLLPPEDRPLPRRQCSPEGLGRAFAAAVERALWNFRLFARAGVHWGSFHNNFTADGRFVLIDGATGGWIVTDGRGRSDVEGRWGRDGDPEDDPVIEVLWRRGLATIGGVGAFDAVDVEGAIEASRQRYTIVLLMSTGCNLACSYCYLGHRQPTPDVAMPLETAFAAVVISIIARTGSTADRS